MALLASVVFAGKRLTVPTPEEAVERMVDIAELKPGENVYDLGCGDGRIVVAAAKRRAVRAVGVEIDPAQAARSRANVERNGVGARVTIVEGNVYKTDLSDADAVFIYLEPEILRGLTPQLRRMKPGSRIVTFDFGIEGAKPSRVERGAFGGRQHCTIFRYDVPWNNDAGTTWDIFTPSP